MIDDGEPLTPEEREALEEHRADDEVAIPWQALRAEILATMPIVTDPEDGIMKPDVVARLLTPINYGEFTPLEELEAEFDA